MSESCDRGTACPEMFARPSQVAFRGMNYINIYNDINSIILLLNRSNNIIYNNVIILFG